MEGAPNRPQMDGSKFEASGKWEGNCFVPLVLKSFVLFFKGELRGGKKHQDLGELPTGMDGR